MEQQSKPTINKQKIRELERKIKRSELKFEILKNALEHHFQAKVTVFNFMLSNEKIYSIRLMSEVLGINRSGYQKWKKTPLNETQKRKILIQNEITIIFYAFKKRYGSERIAVELQKLGHQLSSNTVKKYMRELGLSSAIKKN